MNIIIEITSIEFGTEYGETYLSYKYFCKEKIDRTDTLHSDNEIMEFEVTDIESKLKGIFFEKLNAHLNKFFVTSTPNMEEYQEMIKKIRRETVLSSPSMGDRKGLFSSTENLTGIPNSIKQDPNDTKVYATITIQNKH